MNDASSLRNRLLPARVYFNLACVAGVDLRGLAVFRMLLGLLLLLNLVFRLGDYNAFYTNTGVYTAQQAWRGAYQSVLLEPSLFQPTILLGDALGGPLLFLMGLTAAAMLLLGWRSFWGCLLGWLAVLGLDNRNLSVINGGDDLFRMLLFWSLFLPLGARWSFDAQREDSPWYRRRSHKFVSVATFALLAQLALMYAVSAGFKSYHHWVNEGCTLHFALHVEHYVTPLGLAVRDWLPLSLLSRSTWWLELLAPLFIFCTGNSARLRYLVFAAFVGLHLGIEATMAVGLFSYTAIATWVVLLPSDFWDRVESRLPHRQAWGFGPSRGLVSNRTLNWVVAILLVYIAAWNAWALNTTAPWFPQEARWVGHQLKIHQYWNMFSPTPPMASQWVEARAWNHKGKLLPLYPDGQPMDPRPQHASERVTERWRKWFECLRGRGDESLKKQYAQFVLREARKFDPSIIRVEIVLMEKATPWPGEQRECSPSDTVIASAAVETLFADR